MRRAYADWARGKFGGAVALFDPDIVFESFMPDSSERVIFHGPEGMEVFRLWNGRNMVGAGFGDGALLNRTQEVAGSKSG